MLPFLRDRPVVLVRYPDGIAGKNFFQWNVPVGTPDWLERILPSQQAMDYSEFTPEQDREWLGRLVGHPAVRLRIAKDVRGGGRMEWSLIVIPNPPQADEESLLNRE
mgnify:CR=1 FL=1